jgi:hypothetical protein
MNGESGGDRLGIAVRVWHAEWVRRLVPMKAKPILLGLLIGLVGRTYLQTVNQQSSYAQQLGHAPQQRVYKHMLDRDTAFVYGQIEHRDGKDAPMAVIAVSNTYQAGEVVDVGHFSRSDSYYGLNLPGGEYQLFVVSDLNGDGFYDEREVIGGRALSVNSKDAPEKVLGGCDIDFALPFSPPLATGRLAVRKTGGSIESVIYPKGTIRSLDDPVFSPQMADLGLYEPAAFMEQAPMMFYALEKDQGYKVPVVFVHGIGGSARDFAEMVAHLDALVEGSLKPIDPFQSHFIAACRGGVRPTNPAETAWLKFNKAFPDRGGLK